MRHLGGTVVIEDAIVDALEKFAATLASRGMSARVTISTSDAAAIKVDIGRDSASGTDHVLHAKTSSGRASHFDIGEI